MALGDPVTIGLTADSKFLLAAETGVVIQSSDRSVTSKLKEVWNQAVGYVSAYVFYDWVSEIDFNAIINGVTGLALAAPGVALTLANDLGIGTNKNGVSAGTVYTKSVRISHGTEDLRMISGSAFQRQNITT